MKTRRHLVVGVVVGFVVALVLTPVVFIVTLMIGFGGNSSFGGYGAAAQDNTLWWARPAEYGTLAAWLVLTVAAGYLAARLSLRRTAAKAARL